MGFGAGVVGAVVGVAGLGLGLGLGTTVGLVVGGGGVGEGEAGATVGGDGVAGGGGGWGQAVRTSTAARVQMTNRLLASIDTILFDRFLAICAFTAEVTEARRSVATGLVPVVCRLINLGIGHPHRSARVRKVDEGCRYGAFASFAVKATPSPLIIVQPLSPLY